MCLPSGQISCRADCCTEEQREVMANLKILKQKLLVLGNPAVKVQVSCSIPQTAACATKQELTKPSLLFVGLLLSIPQVISDIVVTDKS